MNELEKVRVNIYVGDAHVSAATALVESVGVPVVEAEPDLDHEIGVALVVLVPIDTAAQAQRLLDLSAAITAMGWGPPDDIVLARPACDLIDDALRRGT